ncbi:Rv3654c family TadE-like protein [Streptomyces sp. NPDC012510]|uniref:Rv3654c family TadE-like protein n=1 Tax=Streptomyces sp. NPDC012510 TaxID=3364838 RepID=UPI0036E32F94
MFGAVLAMGQVYVIRHRAAATADLAALAAADHWMKGGEGACATAERVARAQGGRIMRCEVEGEISDLTAASGTGPLTAESRARAGPPGQEAPRSVPRGVRGTARSATYDRQSPDPQGAPELCGPRPSAPGPCDPVDPGLKAPEP